MYKRILVAIDGSPPSNRALDHAIELAKDQGASLHALYVLDETPIDMAVVDVAGGGYVPPEYLDRWLLELRKSGQRLLARAQKKAASRECELKPILVEVVGASVAQAVLDQTRKLRADLIVMGTHGRRGVRRMVMGSDAEAVLREARVPVLLLRSLETESAARRKATVRKPAPARGTTRR